MKLRFPSRGTAVEHTSPNRTRNTVARVTEKVREAGVASLLSAQSLLLPSAPVVLPTVIAAAQVAQVAVWPGAEAPSTSAGAPTSLANANETERPTLLPERPSTLDALKDPDFFAESLSLPLMLTDKNKLWEAQRAFEALNRTDALFFSGAAGRIDSARFIDRELRMDGDFRYTVGEKQFRAWMQADARMDSVPQGALDSALDPALILVLAKLADPSGQAGQRTGSAVSGDIRPLTPEQIAHYQSLGARYDGKAGKLEHPSAERASAELGKLLERTRESLRNPNISITELAASFTRDFVAIRPLSGQNDAVARIVMDKLLAERSVPPPILPSNQSRFLLTTPQLETELSFGLARTVRLVGDWAPLQASVARYMRDQLSPAGVRWQYVEQKPLLINGMKYALGPDGFVYDSAGRAHWLNDAGHLEPLSQVTSYLMTRRLGQSEDAPAKLNGLTARTREAFSRWQKYPSGNHPRVESDQATIAADNSFKALLPSGQNQTALLELFNPARIAPEVLFLPQNVNLESQQSFTMSRYQQLDLELRMMQRAAREAQNPEAESQLQQYRSNLFDAAKAFLVKKADPTVVAKNNPLGFKFNYEDVQLQYSALRYASLKEADKALKGRVYIFRGDNAPSRFLGIHPESKVGAPSGHEVAKFRAERGGTTNVMLDLSTVLGHSGGTGFQSATTDLQLLARDDGFADKKMTFPINLAAVPKPLRWAIEHQLSTGEIFTFNSSVDLNAALTGQGIPAGRIDVSDMTAEALDPILARAISGPQLETVRQRVQRALKNERPSWEAALLGNEANLVDLSDLFPNKDGASAYQVEGIQDAISRQRDYLVLLREPAKKGEITAETHRRAMIIQVDPAHLIPQMGTLRNDRFENEQEATLLDSGFDSTSPTDIVAWFSQEDLHAPFRAS